jgi:hypothetical protein
MDTHGQQAFSVPSPTLFYLTVGAIDLVTGEAYVITETDNAGMLSLIR